MATNFPASADDGTTLPNPSAVNKTNSPSLSSGQSNQNDAIKAIEAKLGTGASTPANNTFLIGNGSGTSAYSGLTSAQLAARLSDETGTGAAVFGSTPTLVTPQVDTINESTPANGVTIDGLNIKDGHVAPDSVRGTEIQLANNDNLYALNASSSEKMLMKLATDNTIRLGQIYSKVIATSTIQENFLIQTGFDFVTGNGTAANSSAKTITFPVTYSTVLGVIIGHCGGISGSDPTGVTSLNAGSNELLHANNTTTSGFTVGWSSRDSGTTIPNTFRMGFTWIAIGLKV
jgi:hypothetical protein